jgi:hypothetical protein
MQQVCANRRRGACRADTTPVTRRAERSRSHSLERQPFALAELGLIDEYEFVVHPRIGGHGPTLFAGLSKLIDPESVNRMELGSGTLGMQYEPRR